MDLAVKLESPVVVVHPGQMPILGRDLENKVLEYNLESLKECASYAHDCGVTMGVENIPTSRVCYSRTWINWIF